MYKIFSDNNLVYSGEISNEAYGIIEGSLELKVNESGSLSFTIPEGNEAYDKIETMKSVIKVYDDDKLDDDKLIFKGRVFAPIIDLYKNQTFECEGEFSYFNDTYQEPFSYNGEIRPLLEQFVSFHNTQVDESRQFTVGRVTVRAKAQTGRITRSSESYRSTMQALKSAFFGSNLKGYMWIRHEGDVTYLDYLEDFSEVSDQTVMQTINLMSAQTESDSEGFATVIVPIGARIEDEEGTLIDYVTVESENDGKIYIEDAEGVAKYGRITKVVEHDAITVPLNLLQAGGDDLENALTKEFVTTLTAVDLSKAGFPVGSFSIGTYVNVVVENLGINEKMLISGLTIDLLAPEKNTITIGESRNTLTSSMTSAEESIKEVKIRIEDAVTEINTELFDFAEAVRTQMEELQDEIDGNVTTWYYPYAPTLYNMPAQMWTTDEEKNNHIGDLFYDSSTGYAYRFMADGLTWVWTRISDEDITAALRLAQEAQDTADEKRRVFTVQPKPPYDAGDLWLQGPNGDLMTCTTPRATGNYVASDWVKLNKYTDDSTVTNFIQTTYAGDKANLQSQIDGKAETWYQANDPSTAWSTAALKAEHKGDLWYKTTDNTTWYYNGSSWEQQNIPDAVFDEIDGKAQIFVSTPTTPYSVGDLWFNSATSDIMTCTTARASGNYTASDWQKRNKYTDDSALTTFISTTYATDKSDLQSQIDGKAETWYQTSDPSTAWTTAKLKAEHKGDLWYKTTDNTTWYYNGSAWVQQNVPDAVFDKIDGKAQIFISTPTTPYSVGDLWFNSATSDIMTCVTARATGNYTASDWQKRNKYTDDTLAQNTYDITPKYAVCSTGASTVAKTATYSGFVLKTGAQINVRFTNQNTASAPTLNINSTGAKVIQAKGSSIPSDSPFSWKAGAVIQFVYDGTYWQMVNTNAQDFVGYYDDHLDQTAVFNKLTNNGLAQGIFKDANGNLYVNMTYLQGGIARLGGSNNGNGALEVFNSNDGKIVRIDNTGMYIGDLTDGITNAAIKLLANGGRIKGVTLEGDTINVGGTEGGTINVYNSNGVRTAVWQGDGMYLGNVASSLSNPVTKIGTDGSITTSSGTITGGAINGADIKVGGSAAGTSGRNGTFEVYNSSNQRMIRIDSTGAYFGNIASSLTNPKTKIGTDGSISTSGGSISGGAITGSTITGSTISGGTVNVGGSASGTGAGGVINVYDSNNALAVKLDSSGINVTKGTISGTVITSTYTYYDSENNDWLTTDTAKFNNGRLEVSYTADAVTYTAKRTLSTQRGKLRVTGSSTSYRAELSETNLAIRSGSTYMYVNADAGEFQAHNTTYGKGGEITYGGNSWTANSTTGAISVGSGGTIIPETTANVRVNYNVEGSTSTMTWFARTYLNNNVVDAWGVGYLSSSTSNTNKSATIPWPYTLTGSPYIEVTPITTLGIKTPVKVMSRSSSNCTVSMNLDTATEDSVLCCFHILGTRSS